jgi:hypothetical protein
MSTEMADKLTLLDHIVASAQSAKDAMLRGEETEVSCNLGNLSSQLEIATELGVGPAPTPRDMTPSSVSPISYQTSPANAVAGSTIAAVPSQVPAIQPISGLLPSLPVEQALPVMPTAPFIPSPVTQVSAPPPLIHSHSFPNGHQLPSQLHGLAAPTTPMVPSPSFTAALGIQHAPHVSSPLASMPVSRPPSPLRPYPIPEQPWAEAMAISEIMMRSSSDVSQHRRTSDGAVRPDGRPVINRGRSTSITKNRSVPTMTTSMPPSAWQSRHASPDDDDDDDSEDEGPRRTKRRRSSVGNDGPDLSATSAFISDDIRRQLDQIFEEFLNRVCSDRRFI